MSGAVCGCQVDDLVVAMTEELRPQASRVARQLRMQGRQVDLMLQNKKMKQVFKVRHASQIMKGDCGSGQQAELLMRCFPCCYVRCCPRQLCWLLAGKGCERDQATDLYASGVQQAERCGARRLVLLAPNEWEQGLIRVKDLEAREEKDVPRSDFLADWS